MELKEAIKILNELKDNVALFSTGWCSILKDYEKQAIETILNKLENLQKECDSKEKAYNDCYCEYKHYKQFESISKKKIEDNIKQLNSEMQYCTRQNRKSIKLGKIMALQELLEDK